MSPPEGIPLKNYIRRVRAIQVGAGPEEIDLGDEDLVGGYLIWVGEEDQEWVFCPAEVFAREYEPAPGGLGVN